MNRPAWRLSLFAIIFALAACGGNAPSAPTATPPSRATALPTTALAPSSGATVTAPATTAASAPTPVSPATPVATLTPASGAPANTPDNSVPTLDPNAPNTSFETAKLLDKPIKLSLRDSTFYFKLDVPRGGIISSTLSLDAFSPASAKLVLYDEFQNYLKELSVPPGRSASLRYIFANKGGGTTYLALSGNSSATVQGVALAQNDGNSKSDAGDDFPSATSVLPGTLTGLLGDADTQDVYLSDLARAGGVLTTTIKTGDGSIKLTVYDENQNYIGETTSDSNKPAAGVFRHVLATTQGGRWFVQLRGEGSYTLTTAFSAQNDANSGKDAGADFDTALAIKPGAYNGLLGDADTDDVYSLDLSKSGGALTVTVRTTDGDLKATVFDEGQNYVGETAADKTKTSASVYTTLLALNQGGKGYVHVRGEGAYTFSVAFVPQDDAGGGKDAGDSVDTAAPVTSGTFNGTIGFADSTDYFKVPATLGRKLSLKYNGNGSLKVTLYDVNENFIKEGSVNNGASLNLVEDSGSTGDYYVVVSGGEGSYSVTLSK